MSYLKQKYIGTNFITNVKLAQITNKRFKGRLSVGTGNVEDVSLRDILLKIAANYLIEENDFQSGVLAPWATTNNGAGSSVALITSPDVEATGVVQCNTGTNAAGYAGLRYNAAVSMFATQAGELIAITKLRLPTLSTAAQRYTLRIGFGDSLTNADHTDSSGYFEYSDNVNGGRWVMATASNATRTKSSTTVLVAANTWIYLKVITNAAGTVTEFYVNNALVGSIGTNIPSTTARVFDYTAFINKSVGTTSAAMQIDRCFIAKERIDVDNY